MFLVGFLAMASTANAALVSAESWELLKGSPLSGAVDGGVIIGDASVASSGALAIFAAIDPVTLMREGSAILLSGTVTLTGVSPAPGKSVDGQFRWGIYKGNDSSNHKGWLGYTQFSASIHSGGGLIEKHNPNTKGIFASSESSYVQSSTAGGTTLDDGTYDLSLVITRKGTGVSISSTLIEQGGGFRQRVVSADHLITNDTSFTFDRIAFQAGKLMNADQVQYSNVDVTYTVTVIPEPFSTVFLALGNLALVFIRKR